MQQNNLTNNQTQNKTPTQSKGFTRVLSKGFINIGLLLTGTISFGVLIARFLLKV